MPLDRDRIRFKGKLISACMRQNASLEDESEIFFDHLFMEYQATGKPLDESAEWLNEKLSGTFLSMNEKPAWVEEEPTWPFMDGMPMVFISQVACDEGEVSSAKLSPGEVVYLFGARRPVGNGFDMVYRVISQFKDL